MARPMNKHDKKWLWMFAGGMSLRKLTEIKPEYRKMEQQSFKDRHALIH